MLAVVAFARKSMRFGYVAAAGSLISLALLCFAQYGSSTLTWFTIGAVSFNITATIAPLNILLLAVIFLVGAMVYLYSAGFMDTLSEQRRFYIEMVAFQISMAAFAMSGNFILLLIAWEFLSLFSYLLIGFWHVRERASRAARFAITTVLIGDIALIAAIAIFWNVFGTFDFAMILSAIPAHISPALYAAVGLLLIAIFTKSAQFPFQEWLPEAMEGPTPVSAFLHSATMVKAGVFAAIILFPLISAAGLLPVMLWFGIVTAIIATLSAAKEIHIKRVLAYSTVQELSLMLVAIGSGAVVAAIYFFVVQSFYKALLFFSAGSAMKATKEENMDKISGLKSNRLLYVSTLFGALSLAGLIPFSGFFAAAGIGSSLAGNMLVYAIVSLIGLGTSFFIFRWFFLISVPERTESTALMYNAQPKVMRYATAVLAILALASSLLFFYVAGFVSGAGAVPYIQPGSHLSVAEIDAAVITLLFAVGAAASYLMYRPGGRKTAHRKKVGASNGIRRSFLLVYGAAAAFLYEISEGFAVFDLYLSRAFDFLGHLTVLLSHGIRRMSVGGINPYAFIFVVGLVAILTYVLVVLS